MIYLIYNFMFTLNVKNLRNDVFMLVFNIIKLWYYIYLVV